MIAFRDQMMKDLGLDCIVHINQDGVRDGVGPFTHGSAVHTDIMKTVGLKQALDKHKFDVFWRTDWWCAKRYIISNDSDFGVQIYIPNLVTR